MAIGIPSTIMIEPVSSEALQYKTKAGLLANLGGLFYIQYAASSALASSTARLPWLVHICFCCNDTSGPA